MVIYLELSKVGDMTFKIADIKNDYSILLKAKEDSYNYLLKKQRKKSY